MQSVSDQLLRMLETPVPVRVIVEDGEYRCGPDGEPAIDLKTTRFESIRWRTGRRSRSQMAAMACSGGLPISLSDYCRGGVSNATTASVSAARATSRSEVKPICRSLLRPRIAAGNRHRTRCNWSGSTSSPSIR